jgi:hypothetical protein
VSLPDPLFGDESTRAGRALTLQRTLVAVGSAALVGLGLVLGTVAVTDRSDAALVVELLVIWLIIGAVVAAAPVTVAALWVLGRLPRGRWPRIVVGAAAGLLFGLIAELIAVGLSPAELVRTEPGFATMLLLWPLVAGAVGGAIVGPRPVTEAAGPQHAGDAVLGGVD